MIPENNTNLQHTDLQHQMIDTIIIGGGITGCYLLNRLLTVKPSNSILWHSQQKEEINGREFGVTPVVLLESSPRLGGRVETIKFTDTDGTHVQYEAGGARFSDKHKRLVKLLKELDLYNSRIPISSDVMHVMLPEASGQKGLSALFTKYPEIMKIINHIRKYIKTNTIPQSVISMHTLYSFTKDVMNDTSLAKYMLEFYEYYSELATLNMVRALEVFVTEFNNRVQYYVLNPGYESIVTKLMTGISQKEYCKLNTLVTQIKEVIDSVTRVKHFEVITSDLSGNVTTYYAQNLVICIPVDALKKINMQLLGSEKGRENIKAICNKIKPEPLYRIYARFPPNQLPITLPKVATNLPIKYIIPMDPKNGVVMLSYTDGIYAKKLNRIYQRDLQNDTDKLTTLLTDNINKLLPYVTEDKEQASLTTPLWIKHHYWASGAGYWLPGNIPDLEDVTHPIPGSRLYLAGEQVSNHQAWVEGCLETADMVLKQLGAMNTTRPKKNSKHLITYRTKKNKKVTVNGGGAKTYTKDEVAKHNTPDNAWTIINKKVYNITKWIDKHPGGNVILQGIGKDATSMFNHKGGGIGHSASAHKILEKYYIGNLG